ncbi:MAG TPA: TVP38/TMEM64 family protein [Herpetosiphonaceae bacterium]
MDQSPQPAPADGEPWWRRHRHKAGALLVWLAILGGYQWYAWRNSLSPLEAADRLVGALRSGPGPLIYIAIYLVRPLALFPASALTIAGGFVFGPVLGVIYTIIGSNSSAQLAYLLGRYFGRGAFEQASGDSALRRYIQRMRDHSFSSIMIMHLIFLPYDFVNYLAGFLRIRWQPFLLATALGSVPGTLAITLFGSSFKGSLADIGAIEFDLRVFGASLALFAISIAISRVVRRREARLQGRADDGRT